MPGRTSISIRINTGPTDRLLQRLKDKTVDPKPAWRRIALEMQARVSGPNGLFHRLRHGGTHRGVTWRYFAPQYTRKTDGVTVPAWGGQPYAQGFRESFADYRDRLASGRTGYVKGRKRPSGARVKQGDAIMQDTGNLRARAMASVRITRFRLVMGNNLTYGAAQQDMRPYAFFHLPDDLDMMRRVFVEYFDAARSN